MGNAVSAAEANRRFSAILRRVRSGDSIVITSHGRPVARIVPFNDERATGEPTRAMLFDRLRTQQAVDIGRWSRDELYDENP